MSFVILLDKESLGINLKSCLGGYGAYVDLIDENQVEEKRNILVGDLLREVNGINVSLFSVAEVYSVLRQTRRPLSITFWRPVAKTSKDLSLSQVVSDLRNTSWIKRQQKIIGASTNNFETLKVFTSFALAREWLNFLLVDSSFESSFRAQPKLLHEIMTEPSLVPYLELCDGNLFDVCIVALRQYISDVQRTSVFESLCNTFLQPDSHTRYQAYFIRQPEFVIIPFSTVLKNSLGLLSFATVLSSRGLWNCKLLKIQSQLRQVIGRDLEWSRVAAQFAVKCMISGHLQAYYESAAYGWFTSHRAWEQHDTTEEKDAAGGSNNPFCSLPFKTIFNMLPQYFSTHHVCSLSAPSSVAKRSSVAVVESDSRARIRFLIYSTDNAADDTVTYSYAAQSIKYTHPKVNGCDDNGKELDSVNDIAEFLQSSSVLRLLCPQLRRTVLTANQAARSARCTNIIIESEALSSVLYGCSWLTLHDNTDTATTATNIPGPQDKAAPTAADGGDIEGGSGEKMSESVLRIASTAILEARRQWNIGLPVAAKSFSAMANNMAAGANKLLLTPVTVSAAAGLVGSGAVEDDEQEEEDVLLLAPPPVTTTAAVNASQSLVDEETVASISVAEIEVEEARATEDTSQAVSESSDSTDTTSISTPQLIGECIAAISFSPLLLSLRNEELSSPSSSFALPADVNRPDEFGHDLVPELLSPSTFTSLFLAFLLEIPILILSSSADTTSAIIVMDYLKTAIKGLSWPHINAANVPIDMAMELLSCPTPFFVGMHDEVFEAYCQREGERGCWDRSDVLIVHLEDDFIRWPSSVSEELAVVKELSEGLADESGTIGDLSPLWRELFRVMRPVQYRLMSYGHQSVRKEDSGSKSKAKSSGLNEECDNVFFPSQLVVQFPWLEIEALVSKENSSKSERMLVICQSFVQQLLYGWRFCSIAVPNDEKNQTKTKVLCFDEDAFYQLKKHLHRQKAPEGEKKKVMLLSKHLLSFYRRWLRSQGLSLYFTEQVQQEM